MQIGNGTFYTNFAVLKFRVQFLKVICTKASPCTLLLFKWKWITSTLSFMLLEKNDNVFSPWGSVFPRGPFFLRSRVQVQVRFWDDAQNDEQFQKIQKQGAHIIMMDVFRHFKQVNWGIPWIASYVRKKNYLSKGK